MALPLAVRVETNERGRGGRGTELSLTVRVEINVCDRNPRHYCFKRDGGEPEAVLLGKDNGHRVFQCLTRMVKS